MARKFEGSTYGSRRVYIPSAQQTGPAAAAAATVCRTGRAMARETRSSRRMPMWRAGMIGPSLWKTGTAKGGGGGAGGTRSATGEGEGEGREEGGLRRGHCGRCTLLPHGIASDGYQLKAIQGHGARARPQTSSGPLAVCGSLLDTARRTSPRKA